MKPNENTEQKQSTVKKPSKKHQPKGLNILFEDQDIIVVDKINGLLTISTDSEKEKTAHYYLNDYVRKGNSKSRNRVFIVHRLDRETSGILVFAKNEQSKTFLQKEWQSFSKSYYAIINGKLPEKEGEITSYLIENAAHRVYSSKDTIKGKLAITGYKVIHECGDYSLLNIKLLTGRKHQIRVHFSENGFPISGDKMYGRAEKGIKRLALHAASLTIQHPYSKKEMNFNTELPLYFKSMMRL